MNDVMNDVTNGAKTLFRIVSIEYIITDNNNHFKQQNNK